MGLPLGGGIDRWRVQWLRCLKLAERVAWPWSPSWDVSLAIRVTSTVVQPIYLDDFGSGALTMAMGHALSCIKRIWPYIYALTYITLLSFLSNISLRRRVVYNYLNNYLAFFPLPSGAFVSGMDPVTRLTKVRR